jgi:biopolymer transport protein ExbB/TolQ
MLEPARHWIIQAFIDGGPWTMGAIAVVGALTLLLILERIFKLKNFGIDKEDFNEKIHGMILRGDIQQAISFCDNRRTPLTNTIKAGLIEVKNGRPDEEVQVAMDGVVIGETPKIEGWTGFLAVFGNIATLAGLLGTIIGLIKGFGAVSTADPAKKAEILSQGISHALNCTAFGLVVAIPALIAYGYFQVRVGRMINDMVESSMKLMNMVVSNRDKIKG